MPDGAAPFTLRAGRVPLLISLPHVGSEIPWELRERLQDRALASEDSDWHLEAVYAPIAEALGASLLVPRFSRYVIDLNRPPDDIVMYAGANNTELCPTRFFDGTPLYREGCEPDAVERARRLKLYWQPYHAAIERELARLRALHGRALLWDGHSIESELPWLLEGRLPELNLGSNAAQSCSPAARAAVAAVLAAQRSYSQVVTAASRAATSPATTAARPRAGRRCRWRWCRPSTCWKTACTRRRARCSRPSSRSCNRCCRPACRPSWTPNDSPPRSLALAAP